ncbi:MAG: hypothetical protein PVH84_04200 [Candidatus Aminicenantes bacterium]
MFMKIHIKEKGKKSVNLWLPLFLVWILLLALLILVSPILLVIGLLAWIRGYGRTFLYTFPMICAVLWAMSGLRIHIEDGDKKIQLIAV